VYGAIRFGILRGQKARNQGDQVKIERSIDDVSKPNDSPAVDNSASKPPKTAFSKTEINWQEKQRQMIEYFEKVKQEIIEGRKFNDQTTPINTLLTLISAVNHEDDELLWQLTADRGTAEEISQLQELLNSIKVVSIPAEGKSPQESDFCLIDVVIDVPGFGKTPHVCVLGFIEGTWHFLVMMTDNPEWEQVAKRSEARIRSALSGNRR
jgi:hypothetical protein